MQRRSLTSPVGGKHAIAHGVPIEVPADEVEHASSAEVGRREEARRGTSRISSIACHRHPRSARADASSATAETDQQMPSLLL